MDIVNLPSNTWLVPSSVGPYEGWALIFPSAACAFSSGRTGSVLLKWVCAKGPSIPTSWFLCLWAHHATLGSQGDSLASCRTSHSYPFGLWESPLWWVLSGGHSHSLENVRHNLAHLVPVLKNAHRFMSFIELFLPSLLICSFWAPDKPGNQLPWIPCIPIPLAISPYKVNVRYTAHSSVHQDFINHCPSRPFLWGPEILGSRSEGKGKWSKEGGRSNMMMHTHVSLAI